MSAIAKDTVHTVTHAEVTSSSREHERELSSLYIHWPFCPYRCHFCPFVALAGQDEHMPVYHQILMHEIKSYTGGRQTEPLKTVFLGGGTPSTYPLELLDETLSFLHEQYGFVDDYELTIEVNPGTVSLEKLQAWKRMGITRLSIGVQSLNDEVLKKLNRHQKAADVVWLIEHATTLFPSVSVDLIVGLPGVSAEEWKEMIATISRWPIKHISMYFLTVHEDTQLYYGVSSKTITLPCDDEVVDLYYWTIDQLALTGFEQYEISNFSKPGWRSRHNSVYWQRRPYKGFGLGACSFDGERRTQNSKNLLKYLEEIRNTGGSILFSEYLSDKQVWLEQLMLGLRQRRGIVIADILKPLSIQEKEEFSKKFQELLSARLVSVSDGNMMLTPAGLSVANEVIVKLSCV